MALSHFLWTIRVQNGRCSRDGHIADSEISENKGCLESFFEWKECSDGAGNSANRKISSRRFSSLVLFFSQLKKFVTLELLKVGHFVKNVYFPRWNEIFESNTNFLVHPLPRRDGFSLVSMNRICRISLNLVFQNIIFSRNARL